MDWYIDADIAHRKMQEFADTFFCDKHDIHSGILAMAEKISQMPSADVEAVRHGRWVKDAGGNWTCTSCGGLAIPHPILTDTHQCTTPYCHHCGSKMDFKEDEANNVGKST